MSQCEVMFLENGVEIDLDMLPIEYINGVIQLCKDELVRRERWDRVYNGLIAEKALKGGAE